MYILDDFYENSTTKNEKNIAFFIMTLFIVKSMDFTWLYNGGHYRFDGDLFAAYKGLYANLNSNPKIISAALFGLHKTRIFVIFGIFVAGYAKAVGKLMFLNCYFL